MNILKLAEEVRVKAEEIIKIEQISIGEAYIIAYKEYKNYMR